MNLQPKPLSELHKQWSAHRAALETEIYKLSNLKITKWMWITFERSYKAFYFLLKITGLNKRGLNNARDFKIVELDLYFDQLPEEFEGYKILHMSDLHVDALENIHLDIVEKIKNLSYDTCVITGDYRDFIFGKHLHIYDSLKYIFDHIQAPDGVFATMGNHDSHDMLPYLEAVGFRMLINETVSIKRDEAEIKITGLDDPYFFYSEHSEAALTASGEGFKILLIHAPEMYQSASANNYSLYLCGHTHGGQICFPWGRPLYINLNRSKHLHSGLWQEAQLTGYTSKGTGVCTMPVRYFTRGEIEVFTLRKTRF